MLPVRILLLEDDTQLRTALGQVLELEGYEVVTAADGAEAVEKARDFPFELLIFDVKLPGPDGLEVLAKFKQANPDLPSIVMTGYATEADTLRALRLGVGEYLEKPFNSGVLINAVRRLEKAVFQLRQSSLLTDVVLKLVLWSLQFLNRDAAGSVKATLPPKEAGILAYRAALAQGYDESAAREAQAAVLLYLAQELHADQEGLEELSILIPEPVQYLRDSLQDGETQEGLLRIASLCSRLPFDSNLWTQVRPLLNEQDGSVSTRLREKQRRHLLSLGRSLSATGDVEGARSAFEEVRVSASPGERGFALVELSRLAWKAGESKKSLSLLRELMQLLPSLGPQACVELELEATQVSLSMGLEQGTILLRRAKTRLERLGLDTLLCQVNFALGLLEPEEITDWPRAIESCLTQARLDFLTGGANWLLPRLAKLEGVTPSLKRLANRIAQSAPGAVGRFLDATEDPVTLESLLNLLSSGGLSQQGEALQRLVKRDLGRVSAMAAECITRNTEIRDELRIYCIGAVEIWIGDTPVPREMWRTSRSLHILARLALAPRHSAVQDSLLEEFWPGTAPQRSKRNLSQALTDLRRALRDSNFEKAGATVERKHDSVLLNPELEIWLDKDAFDQAVDKAEQAEKAGDLREAISRYREAVLLVRGEFMEDCYLEWCEPHRRDFERQYIRCLESLAHCCAEVGMNPEVEEVAAKLLAKDPCHQVAHRLLMESYVNQKRPEQAIRHFERARVTLLNELGIEPHTDLLRAYQVAKLAL